jgi:hypothetical protein
MNGIEAGAMYKGGIHLEIDNISQAILIPINSKKFNTQ